MMKTSIKSRSKGEKRTPGKQKSLKKCLICNWYSLYLDGYFLKCDRCKWECPVGGYDTTLKSLREEG